MKEKSSLVLPKNFGRAKDQLLSNWENFSYLFFSSKSCDIISLCWPCTSYQRQTYSYISRISQQFKGDSPNELLCSLSLINTTCCKGPSKVRHWLFLGITSNNHEFSSILGSPSQACDRNYTLKPLGDVLRWCKQKSRWIKVRRC